MSLQIGISVDAKSLDRFGRAVLKASKGFPKDLQEALQKAGYVVERRAKQESPVDTGRMRASINTYSIAAMAGRPHIAVGPHTNYAEYVHRRNPFMARAYMISYPQVNNIMKQALDEVAVKIVSSKT